MSARTYGTVLVVIATILWSSAGFFVRAVEHLDIWTILAWRSLFGAITLCGVALYQSKLRLGPLLPSLGRHGAIAAVISAVSMLSYIVALKLTTVANVLAIYGTVPFVASGLAFVWMGERVERRVLVASGIALAGVLIVAGFAVRPQDIAGNALAFLMTLTFATLLIMSRRYPFLKTAPVNALAAFLCAFVCLPLMPAVLLTPFELMILAMFGFCTTALAYLLFMAGGRHIPPAEAGLIGLLDVVLGPFWVWLAFGEQPARTTLIGGSLILAAVAWHLYRGWRPAPKTAGL